MWEPAFICTYDDITDLDKPTAENPLLSINLLEYLMKLDARTGLHLYVFDSLTDLKVLIKVLDSFIPV